MTIFVYSGVFALVASNFQTLLDMKTFATTGEKVVFNHEKLGGATPQMVSFSSFSKHWQLVPKRVVLLHEKWAYA